MIAVHSGDIVCFKETGENHIVLDADDAGNFTYYKSYRAFGGSEVGVRFAGNTKHRGDKIQIIRRIGQ